MPSRPRPPPRPEKGVPNRFRIGSESVPNRFRIGSGATVLGLFWDRFGTVSGPFWDPCRYLFWDCFGTVLGPFGDLSWNPCRLRSPHPPTSALSLVGRETVYSPGTSSSTTGQCSWKPSFMLLLRPHCFFYAATDENIFELGECVTPNTHGTSKMIWTRTDLAAQVFASKHKPEDLRKLEGP